MSVFLLYITVFLSVCNVCARVPLACTWQELDRAATSASVVHAADLMLRSLVSASVKAAVAQGSSGVGARAAAAAANAARAALLTAVKAGDRALLLTGAGASTGDDACAICGPALALRFQQEFAKAGGTSSHT